MNNHQVQLVALSAALLVAAPAACGVEAQRQERSAETIILAGVAAVQPASPADPTAADSAAIRAAALDYIEGWYEGDAERMSRALHPELAKRIVEATPAGDRIENMTAAELVEMTARRNVSSNVAGAERREVWIMDVFGAAASVRVDAEQWVDYLHLARWNGEWRIINVLWALR